MSVDFEKAVFYPQGSSRDASEAVKVHFNPQTLQYDLTNKLKADEDDETVQYVSQSSAKLAMELIWDSTDNGKDVRDSTKKLLAFMQPRQAQQGNQQQAQARRTPSLVTFEWGAFSFTGYIESWKEVLELFSGNGVPLRARVNIAMTQQDVTFSEATRASGRDAALADDAVTLSDAPSVPLERVESSGGNPNGTGRDTAEANGLESSREAGGDQGPLFVGGRSGSFQKGLGLDGLPTGGVGAGFGAGLGAGIGIGGGLGVGIGGGLGISGGLGVSGGVGLGLSGGVGLGLSGGVGIGASFGLSASVGFSASASFSASFNASTGLGASAGSGSGATSGGGLSQSRPADGGVSAAAGVSTSAAAAGPFAVASAVVQLEPGVVRPPSLDAKKGSSASFAAAPQRRYQTPSGGVAAAAELRQRFPGLHFDQPRRKKVLDGERVLKTIYGSGPSAAELPDTFLPGGQAVPGGAVRADVGQGLDLRSLLRFDEDRR